MAVVRAPDFIIVGGASGAGAGGSGCSSWTTEIPKGALNGTNTVFRLNNQPSILLLMLNGVVQNPFVDYTISGSVITYTVAPVSTDQHWAVYCRGSASSPGLRARLFGTSAGATTDKLNVGGSSLYLLPGDITLACWIKCATSASGEIMFRGKQAGSSSSADNDSFDIYPVANGSLFDIGASHEHGSSIGVSVTLKAGLKANVWYFIGVVRNTSTLTYSLFIGTETSPVAPADAKTYGTNPDGGGGPDCQFTIGHGQSETGSSGNTVFNGTIEETYLWSRQLLMSEIEAARTGNPSATNLLWACAMGNTPEIDNSGNGGSGTITGTTLVAGHL